MTAAVAAPTADARGAAAQSVLVTGASGFVGRAVVAHLLEKGFAVRGATRRSDDPLPSGAQRAAVGALEAGPDWRPLLSGVSTVVHCAARVHRLDDRAADPLAECRAVNRDVSTALAVAAARAGVRRLVFLSTVKVLGESTLRGQPFRCSDFAAPQDPYAQSKHEAELALTQIAADSGLELVIVRPPLVYGPGVRANFRAMLSWLDRGRPLPLASIENRRSLVGLGNLADLIWTCVTHPAAAGQTFLVSDGDDLSTPELLRRCARALNRPARLLPCPPSALVGVAGLVGRADVARRLCESLEVDITATRSRLGWAPPWTVDEGLTVTARHFRNTG